MKAKWLIGAIGAFLMACGSTEDGQVSMEVAVSGLTQEQNFCFTWKLYQQDAQGAWEVVDGVSDAICAAKGDDVESSVGSCYDGRRFLVTYDVAFYDADVLVGTAKGTSGGGERDLCVKNYDTPSSALFQFGNEGNVGGVNPGLVIDQVCANDKLQVEDGKVISAIWMSPDSCGAGTPDSYCALAYPRFTGETAVPITVRKGITEDGSVRFAFNEGPFDSNWAVFYLAFGPEVPANTLILQHNPFSIGHENYAGYGPVEWGTLDANTIVSYRLDDDAGSKVGLIWEWVGSSLVWTLSTSTADCNGDVVKVSYWQPYETGCTGYTTFLGAIKTGADTFDLAFTCGAGLVFLGCDTSGACGGMTVTESTGDDRPPAAF